MSSDLMRSNSPFSLRYFSSLGVCSLTPIIVKLALTNLSKSTQRVLTALSLKDLMMRLFLKVLPNSKCFMYLMNITKFIFSAIFLFRSKDSPSTCIDFLIQSKITNNFFTSLNFITFHLCWSSTSSSLSSTRTRLSIFYDLSFNPISISSTVWLGCLESKEDIKSLVPVSDSLFYPRQGFCAFWRLRYSLRYLSTWQTYEKASSCQSFASMYSEICPYSPNQFCST